MHKATHLVIWSLILVMFFFAVLWNDRNELLHCVVWCVPGLGCIGSDGVEQSARIPSGTPQVHEHRRTYVPSGGQVRLEKVRQAAGTEEVLK